MVENRTATWSDEPMTRVAQQMANEALTLQNEALRATIMQLRHEITLFHKRLYGNRTEKTRTAEIQLLLSDLLKTEAALQRQLDAQVAAAKAAWSITFSSSGFDDR